MGLAAVDIALFVLVGLTFIEFSASVTMYLRARRQSNLADGGVQKEVSTTKPTTDLEK